MQVTYRGESTSSTIRVIWTIAVLLAQLSSVLHLTKKPIRLEHLLDRSRIALAPLGIRDLIRDGGDNRQPFLRTHVDAKREAHDTIPAVIEKQLCLNDPSVRRHKHSGAIVLGQVE